MKRQKIDINGITTTTHYQEGDCVDMVNLRKKNGALHPVTPRKTVMKLPKEYDQLYWHKNNDYENLIGLNRSGVDWLNKQTDQTWKATEIHTGQDGELSEDTTIAQIGNILTLAGTNHSMKLLYRNGKYEKVEIDPKELPQWAFKVDAVPLKTKTIVGEKPTIQIVDKDEHYATIQLPHDATARHKAVRGQVYEMMRKNRDKGRIFGFVMVCMAYELYDGSVAYHSQPILLGQSNDRDTREGVIKNGRTYTYRELFYRTYLKEETETDVGKGGVRQEIIRGYYPQTDIHTKGEGQIGSVANRRPNLSQYIQDNKNMGGGDRGKWTGSLHITFNELSYSIPSAIAEKYKHLIRGVNVYMTKECYLYDFEEDYESVNWENKNFKQHILRYHLREEREIREELLGSQFHKVAFVPFEQIADSNNIGKWVKMGDILTDKLGDKLHTQEVMPIDSGSWHTIEPKRAYAYNHRLHLYQYDQTYFGGWTIDQLLHIAGVGQWGYQYRYNPNENPKNVKARVVVEIEGSRVVSRGNLAEITEMIAPMLTYPDRRATKLSIFLSKGDTDFIHFKSYLLKPHPTLNVAYYLSEDLMPNGYEVENGSIEVTELNEKIRIKNTIKVSELDNPFYFPASQHYQVGSGSIIGIASNVMSVSDRNFGQYPLFVATTEGWFMLQQGRGGEVLYANVTPISSGDMPIKDILCPTPFGVVYLSMGGVYRINANGSELITPQVEEMETAWSISEHIPNRGWQNKLIGVIHSYKDKSRVSFADFLPVVSDILYDHKENELLLLSDEYEWVFAFHLDSKTIYRRTEEIAGAVQNVYPALWVMDGGSPTWVKDMEQEGESKAHVSFITRPFDFGTSDLKWLERIYMRGWLIEVEDYRKGDGVLLPVNDMAWERDIEKQSTVALFCSDDEIDFQLTRGVGLKEGNYRDVQLGLMPRNRWRWYMVAMGGVMHRDSVIKYLDCSVEVVYRNGKMR